MKFKIEPRNFQGFKLNINSKNNNSDAYREIVIVNITDGGLQLKV